jgi:hypothetical protein
MRFRRETKFSEEQIASTGVGGRHQSSTKFLNPHAAKPAGSFLPISLSENDPCDTYRKPLHAPLGPLNKKETIVTCTISF